MKKNVRKLLLPFISVMLLLTVILSPAGTASIQADTLTDSTVAACAVSTKKPGKVTLKKVSASGASVKVTWKKVSSADGYCVYYKKANGKWKKAKLVQNASKTSCKITGLSSGKKYSFKVRAYKTADGKKVWGKYSNSKSVKVTSSGTNKYVKSGWYDYYDTSSYRNDMPLAAYGVHVDKLSKNKIKVKADFVWNYGNRIADTGEYTVSVSKNKTAEFSFKESYYGNTGKMKLTFKNGYLIMKYKWDNSDTWYTHKLTYNGND